MKKYIYSFVFLSLVCMACNDSAYDYNLKKMGQALKEYMKVKDLDNNTVTEIEFLRPISYDKIPDNERSQPNDSYLCKIYVKGTWAYMNSSRVYNMDDTLKCIFDEKMAFVRVEKTPNKE